ncbi:MAG: response regulator [Kofleriaceae bacterium]|nr:response regulator [Kofleriaceae bacterium]
MSRAVMILDDDDDLRETLAEMFQLMCGVETLLAPDVEGMVAIGNEVLRSAIAFIDVNLGPGQPSGLDAYHWLVEHEYHGRVVFLTGHARLQTQVEQAVIEGIAEVVQKPANAKVLCELVEKTAE